MPAILKELTIRFPHLPHCKLSEIVKSFSISQLSHSGPAFPSAQVEFVDPPRQFYDALVHSIRLLV